MADIGSTLREARIRARIDMQEVESRTKIRAKYLRAIENEEWDLLPGPVYAKSFLRAYSDYLGLDSRLLVEEFKRRYEAPADHEPPRPVASLQRERERSRMPRPPTLPSWAPIVAVLAVIVAALFLVGTLFGGNKKTPSPTGLHAGVQHHAHHATPPHVTLPVVPQTATLQLTPTAPVYVCLVNGSGKRLIFEKTYSAGQTVPTFKERKMLLTVGNANAHVKVNGRPYPLTQSPTAIRLLVTATAVHPIAMSQAPTCP